MKNSLLEGSSLENSFSESSSSDTFILAGKKFKSRLILGSGKFSSHAVMQKAILASQTEMLTMALRRIDLDNSNDDFMNSLSGLPLQFLPNTSGARNSSEAIKLASLARQATGNPWVKIEVTPEPRYLLPDGEETLIAARELVKAGFIVLPYIQADLILAKKLVDVGCPAVMPLGSPIGSNQGLKTLSQLKIIIKEMTVPVIVDAGIGSPSQAAQAMEIGADAVLVNTAIAIAEDPVQAATAFALAVQAGRLGFNSKLATSNESVSKAYPSSPLKGIIG